MRGLQALPGMVEVLEDRVRGQGVPLLASASACRSGGARPRAPHDARPRLDRGEMAPMDPRGPDGTPSPCRRWLEHPRLHPRRAPAAGRHPPGEHAYFVHSYALRGAEEGEVAATTDYGGPVVAIVARGNVAGTQFHVEKSAALGLRLLANFLRWEP
jgi:glutamine amidotransferase